MTPKGAEKRRLLRLKKIENEIRAQGHTIIVGLDEAGRGPLAGPVHAAVCHIPQDIYIEGVADSKILLPEKRAIIFEQFKKTPEIVYAVGIATAEEIDHINIYQATKLAMRRAIEAFSLKVDFLLIGGMSLPELAIPQKKVIKGDAISYLIAAASIVAKETRDSLMRELDLQYPGYGFAKHKGYGTAAHLEAIQRLGLSPIHRKSFAPCKI